MALTRATDKIIANAGGNLNLSGIVTATSFSGSGANLTGIDATAIKFGSDVKVQANNSGATVTGILTATKFVGQADISGGSIVGTSATFSGNVSIGGTLTYEDVTNVDSIGVVTARSGVKIGPAAGVAGTFFADGSYVTAGVITATTFHGSGANLTSLPTQITINNNSNGRVITATGNANELDGQANLTFSNSSNDPKLTITGSGHAQLFLTNTSGADHTGVNFGDSADTNAGMIQYTNSNNTMQFHTNGTEKLRIDSSGTTFSFSPDSTTPNIKWRSNDTNWFGSLNQSVAGSTISTILSTGGDWSASGTTYSATKAIASFPTGALVLHNQYNSDATGAQLVFLNKAGGSSTTDGTVSERLRIHSTGRTQVNLPSTSGSSSAISTAQAIVGTKHIHTVYHNFNSTNSGLAINSVIPTNSTGTVDIMGGWANGNGITFKRFVWCASGDTAISQVFSTAASRYGVSVSISTPTMSISGDYVNFNFTFSDSQGSKMEKLKIHFEYHKQFYVI